MQIIQENLALCPDCTQAAVNDDYTGLDYHYSEKQAAIRMKEIQAGLSQFKYLVWNSEEEESFSWSGCDCCGSELGATVNYFNELGE